MATLDLQPLSDETIDQMGFNNHDLWLVRIEKEVLGPFETEALKQYALAHEDLFSSALATRMDEHKFAPFWNHPQFQRRAPQVVAQETHQNRIWLLISGQKSGPFNSQDINKKIEMGLLAMTDHISIDEGHHWKKVYEIEGFDRRDLTADQLPVAPTEASFQKAKLQLVEKLEKHKTTVRDELAEVCFHGQSAKVLTLKLDELTLNTIKPIEVSSSMKWAAPGAAAAVVVVLTIGFFAFAPDMVPLPEEKVTTTKKKPFYQLPETARPAPQGIVPRVERIPASVGHAVAPTPTPRSAFNQDSRYPTIMETHNNDRPFEEPVVESYPQEEPEVHSLVNQAPMEDQSLDAAMSGIEQPVIEEASDF